MHITARIRPPLLVLALLAPACSGADTKDVNSALKDGGKSDAGISDAAEPDAASDEPRSDAQTSVTMDAAEDAAQGAAEAGAASDTSLGSDGTTSAETSVAGDAGSDASAATGLVKSRCAAPISVDSAVRLANFPLMRSRPNGNIAVTWQEIDAVNAPYRNVVRAFNGTSFGEQHVLSEDGASRTEAAIDDQGNIHAYWAENLGQDREREDYDARSGQWSGKAQWFTGRGTEIGLPLPAFAVNKSGLTLHTKFYNQSGVGTVAAAFFDPGAAQWSTLFPLEGASNLTSVSIPLSAINDAGKGVVVWEYTDNTGGKGLRYMHASTFENGSFSAPISVAGGNSFFGVAMLSGGDAIVAYFNTDRISARRFSPSAGAGQEWGPEVTVDMVAPGTPTLRVDAADNVTAVWTGGQEVRAARYQGGAWQPSTSIGFTDLGFDVAVARGGEVSVVYAANSAPIKLRRLAAGGGTWTDPIDAANETGTVQTPMVAHDAAGNVVVAYALGRALPQGGTDAHIRWVVCE